MAITKPTTTSDFSGFLKPNEAKPIFDEAAKSSVVQSLVRRVPVGINGEEIPIVTSKPTAGWVDEGGTKPTTETKLGLKTIKPKKLAAIAVVSSSVVRANPGGYIDIYKRQIAEAFATAFDLATLHDKGGDGTGTGPFDDHIGKTTKSVQVPTSDKGLYGDLVTGIDLLLKQSKRANGFAFDSMSETLFLGEVDKNNRPIFIPGEVTDATAPVQPGSLLGRPAFLGEGVGNDKTIGFVGDWTKAAWGVTSGISYRISTEATVTIDGELVSLFEKNLVAILAEAEYGWVCADTDAFAKFVIPTE